MANRYRLNYGSTTPGGHTGRLSFPFQAADDGGAEAIADAIMAALVAQEVALTKYVVDPAAYGVHSLGSQYTAQVRLVTDAGEFFTFRVRNVAAATTESDLETAVAGMLLPSGATPDDVRAAKRRLPRSRGA